MMPTRFFSNIDNETCGQVPLVLCVRRGERPCRGMAEWLSFEGEVVGSGLGRILARLSGGSHEIPAALRQVQETIEEIVFCPRWGRGPPGGELVLESNRNPVAGQRFRGPVPLVLVSRPESIHTLPLPAICVVERRRCFRAGHRQGNLQLDRSHAGN